MQWAHVGVLCTQNQEVAPCSLLRMLTAAWRLCRANIASIVGSEDACGVLAATLAGVEGVAAAENLLPYVVRAVVLQPYASAKLVRVTAHRILTSNSLCTGLQLSYSQHDNLLLASCPRLVCGAFLVK